jgi:hypothetical protein
VSPPTAGPSAHRLRALLGAPRESVVYAHDAQFHATVEYTCQLLDVIDTVTDASVARDITHEFARLLSDEHAADAHKRICELDEQIAAARLGSSGAGGAGGGWPGARRLTPAARVMTGYTARSGQIRDAAELARWREELQEQLGKSGQPYLVLDSGGSPHKFGTDCPNYPYGCSLCIPLHDITVHEHPHEHLGIRHAHAHRHRTPDGRDSDTQPDPYIDTISAGVPSEYEPVRDAVIENLASLNELTTEIVAKVAEDAGFARDARNLLRRHSWRLGMLFQGEMGDPDAPAESAGRDEGSAEHQPGEQP